MKSKNILNYSQPDFYRFTSDSVELARFVNQFIGGRKVESVLDLCCGCGVVGIEFESLNKNIEKLTFLELQVDFREHILENTKNLDCDFEIEICDFQSYKSAQQYDLILSNPPYFELGSGRIGPDKKRNLCRHFEIGIKEKLIKKVFELLNDGGQAFVVDRDDLCKLDSRIEKVGELNKANLFRFFLNID
ncbi:hypothetical protein A9Q84_08195 [Halobacteriovorax marinus]|uniref:Methyltransferase small domain-containing protein n=1 Tax=Halobacteriovorax marinus TaxID=97084 RepID=A0A1Y5F607_9BACT|nr:hypothetical protein A9Q84_08195 [Halobacteriovorax marinus]